ncbi:MAG: PAS domain-containing protein [Chitinophagales bacterium]|nr:PAS domain-containing protein [Chitinophagales bacterium]
MKSTKLVDKIIHFSKTQLSELKYIKHDVNFLDKIPLNLNQCLYIINWQEGRVAYQKRIKEIFGYEKEEFELQTILDGGHPEDREIVLRVSNGVIKHAIENNNFNQDNTSHSIIYRFRKKNGDYIKILRQSTIFEFSEQGNIISNLSIVSDVTDLIKTNYVKWDLNTPAIYLEDFKKTIYTEFIDFFTSRELEIIRLVFQNKTSEFIAQNLFISKHTVNTHRKNILKKSNCKTVLELLDFCNINGII